ncbi:MULTISPECIES: hypothetical protein [Borreliella]|uniref:Outer membrane protein n=1 Tax=Borrelia garinii subsp. bavariensis (strain ATCC BAA-2496 / DSM 23469 / PBi) TaxID=290434 RepID=A0A7I6GV94_BORGP|nr:MULTISPECIES: hypothetical protein [Borreliella]AAT93810.1 outer membrane protein [Borreliella bavariensis PBi]AZA27155.1 hypothetical protein DB299_04405 [Borreliella bavariensis PBi]WLN24546.1 hypothetical protein IDK87_04585 [Borreliella bavariensis]
MRQFKLILIFFLFIVSIIYASVVRPFDFEKWNFKKDIDLAYVLMHDVDNGILIKSQDKAGNIKSQEILAKLNKLKAYSYSLQKIIKKRLARSRFQKEVELPLLKIFRKYKYLTRNYKNKRFIENPEYTKLILEKNIKKVVFLENYFRSRLKNVKSRKEIEKRINANQSSFKSPKDKTSSSLKSKFSSSKNSKSPQGFKKCNKRRLLKKYDLNRADGELLDDLENEDLENLENEDFDEPYSEDYGFTEETQDEDEF